MKMQNGFFMTEPFNPNPYWDGTVLFEQNTPGDYVYTFQYKVKCGLICVGGGSGGFCAKMGIKINEGTPSEQIFSGLAAWSGGSGGYSNRTHVFEKGDILRIHVGNAGAAFSSSSLYGTVSQSNPSISLNTHGESSVILQQGPMGQTTLIGIGGGSSGGRFYLSNPSDPNSLAVEVMQGGTGLYNTNGNDGQYGSSPSSVSLNGGASVYNNYGAGGDAGYTGDNQSGTPWADNGGAGYVKIYAVVS